MLNKDAYRFSVRDDTTFRVTEEDGSSDSGIGDIVEYEVDISNQSESDIALVYPEIRTIEGTVLLGQQISVVTGGNEITLTVQSFDGVVPLIYCPDYLSYNEETGGDVAVVGSEGYYAVTGTGGILFTSSGDIPK